MTLLVDARRAASMCGVSTATWWRWDAAGKVPRPPRPSSGCTRWRVEDLQQWCSLGCPDREQFEAAMPSH